MNGGNADEIDQMLQLTSDQANLPQWQRLALLKGIERAHSQAARRCGTTTQSAGAAGFPGAGNADVRSGGARKGRADRRPAGVARQSGLRAAGVDARNGSLQAAFRGGAAVLSADVRTCHQVDGEGQEGMAASPVSPSLVEDVRRATASRDEPWTEEELRTMLH